VCWKPLENYVEGKHQPFDPTTEISKCSLWYSFLFHLVKNLSTDILISFNENNTYKKHSSSSFFFWQHLPHSFDLLKNGLQIK
jgi:hypothetical protein